MCLDKFDEISESHLRDRRNREFVHQLRDLASQSDWTLRYPSAKFPTVVQKIQESPNEPAVVHSEGATKLETWSRHRRGLASISSKLLDAVRYNSEFTIADFIVAGSLGKDTAVEHFTTDVDLLVVFKTFDPSRYCKYLDFIENALMRGSNAGDLKLMRKSFPVRMMGLEKPEVGSDDIMNEEATYLRVVWKTGEIAELLPVV
jgi:hypothetical protein